MNLGVYINTLDEPKSQEIFTSLNEVVKTEGFRDVSLFYNDVAHNPIIPRFGVFNSTDIWYFTGHLICTSLDNTLSAIKSINKFKLYYLFDKNNKDLIKLMQICNDCKILSSLEDEEEVFRLTNKKPHLTGNFKNLITGLQNESRKTNS